MQTAEIFAGKTVALFAVPGAFTPTCSARHLPSYREKAAELRAKGVFINVPDWYILAGSNKTGMGYRETNWSLPREQQLIQDRANVKPKPNSEFMPVIDPMTKQPVPGFGMDAEGKVHDFRSNIEKISGRKPEPGASGPFGGGDNGPKVGEVRSGYKFNGKFPPGDKRAWDKVK